jgi:hypothetical protein
VNGKTFKPDSGEHGRVPHEVVIAARHIRELAGLGDNVLVVVFCIAEIGEGDEVAIGRNVYITRPQQLQSVVKMHNRQRTVVCGSTQTAIPGNVKNSRFEVQANRQARNKMLSVASKVSSFQRTYLRATADENEACVSRGGVLLDSHDSRRLGFADVAIKKHFAR